MGQHAERREKSRAEKLAKLEQRQATPEERDAWLAPRDESEDGDDA